MGFVNLQIAGKYFEFWVTVVEEQKEKFINSKMSNDTSTRKKLFLEKYPEYGYQSNFEIDLLRNTEFSRLKGNS